MNIAPVRFGHVFEVRGPHHEKEAFDLFAKLILQEKDTRQHVKKGIYRVSNEPGMNFIHSPHGSPQRSFVVTDGDIEPTVLQQRQIMDARGQGKRQLANRLMKNLTRFLKIAARKAPDLETILKPQLSQLPSNKK